MTLVEHVTLLVKLILRLDKGTITVPSAAVSSAVADNNGTGVIFKNCPPFTDSITEIRIYK